MSDEQPMITCTPGVKGGYLCIKGTRTPVRAIVEYYEMYDGAIDEILLDLPHLNREQIQAALDYHRTSPEDVLSCHEDGNCGYAHPDSWQLEFAIESCLCAGHRPRHSSHELPLPPDKQEPRSYTMPLAGFPDLNPVQQKSTA